MFTHHNASLVPTAACQW